MERHTAVFMLCLQPWLVFSTNTVPVPAFKEIKVPAESPSESTGKLLEKRISLPISVSADMKSSADDLLMRNNETEKDNDDGDILSHISETGSDAGNKSSIYEEKRRMRLVKRGESGNERNFAQQESRRHSLQKRQAGGAWGWSISNALEVLSQMVYEEEQRRLDAEREELKRRLFEAGQYTGITPCPRTTPSPLEKALDDYIRRLEAINDNLRDHFPRTTPSPRNQQFADLLRRLDAIIAYLDEMNY